MWPPSAGNSPEHIVLHHDGCLKHRQSANVRKGSFSTEVGEAYLLTASALPPKADIRGRDQNVRCGPIPEISYINLQIDSAGFMHHSTPLI
jgi:hypothetical protein